MGIAARNGILLINHCQHLETYVRRACRSAGTWSCAVRPRRLSPILMTTLATATRAGAARGDGQHRPGHEIEHPMAVVILGGLVTSTLVNLFVVPSLYLRFAQSRKSRKAAEQELAVQEPAVR
jgi:multidrug efflux pump subunit AcrB